MSLEPVTDLEPLAKSGDVQRLPETVDQALSRTVIDMLAGDRVESEKDSSFEVLHYLTGMSKPRCRIAGNPERPLNIVGAVARFVWMVAGSNRLEDIAFYEDKVRGYTDNDLTVPGSSYGKRLFDAAPGLDQIRGVIARLTEDRQTRQAAAVVWVPEDAVRTSRDIPCSFGMFFHVRGGKLVMCTVMRSNHAFRLLPYNFFEFSLLGEVVSATLGIPMGDYVHFAASMHVYGEMDNVRRLAEAPPGTSIEMPLMPGPDEAKPLAAGAAGSVKAADRARDLATALGQVTELARTEAQLRHAYTRAEFDAVRAQAKDRLNEYWLALFNVLAAWGAAKREWPEAAAEIVDSLPHYLYAPTRDILRKKFPGLLGEPAPAVDSESLALFEMEPPLMEDVPTINPVFAPVAESAEAGMHTAALQALVDYHTRGHELAVDQMPGLVRALTRDSVALAARSEVRSEGKPADRYHFTDEMIRAAIEELATGES